MRPERRQERVTSWRLALLALLAAACAQLAVAEHQFEHDAGIAGDVCAVCLQLEQFDVPQATAPAVEDAGAAESVVEAGGPEYRASEESLPYESRAPPRID